jgi:hypothetical protein
MSETALATWAVMPATRKEVDDSGEQAKALVSALKNYRIETPEDEAQISQLMNEAHQNVKELDNLRLKVAKPASDAKRAVDDFFRPALSSWKEAKELSKRLLPE